MHRRILGLAVAFVLVAGVFALGSSGTSVVYGKGRTAAKSSSSKKKATKSSRKSVSKKSAKRSNDRASARAGKRGKNDDRISRRAGRPERRPAQKSVVRYDAAKTPTSDDDDESLAEDEPALPRPANRFVSDIAPGRVTEIQNALMKAGVFAGPATGVYDQTTFDAMTTFQARRGFGATGMPTAEALKALGVRKNSGIGLTTPAVVVQSTAPSAATSTSIPTPPPNR
jgi:hypothetical protein